jgi:hypothetical protein
VRQGRQPPEAYNKLYAMAMDYIRGVQVPYTPRIGLVGPEATKTHSIGGVQHSCMPWIVSYPRRTGILYASDAMARPAQPSLPKLHGVRHFCTPRLYSIFVRLRYIAVAYRFFRTPLMIIPPMTYFLVV